MTQRFYSILLLAVLPLAGHAASTEEILRDTLLERIKPATIHSLRKLPNVDLYEVLLEGNRIIYTDSKAELAFAGPMIDLKTRQNLTQQRVQELLRVDFAGLPFDQSIVRIKGKGTRKLAVFSDPDCPYCQQLEKDLALLDDVTIYTFLYPIPELHPNATHMANAIWCAEQPAKAWDDYLLRGIMPKAAKTDCKAPLADVATLAKRAHIEGTPGVVFADGTLIPGAIDARTIEKKFQALAPAVTNSANAH